MESPREDGPLTPAGFELACDEAVTLPFGVLRRAPGGWVELAQPHGAASVVVPELDDADELTGLVLAAWVCTAGSPGAWVLRCGAEPATLRVDRVLPRLDLRDRYDPGGLHRVRLHAVATGSCLVETEVGLALVPRLGAIDWTWAHDDLTARVAELRGDEVVLADEHGRRRIRLPVPDRAGELVRSAVAVGQGDSRLVWRHLMRSMLRELSNSGSPLPSAGSRVFQIARDHWWNDEPDDDRLLAAKIACWQYLDAQQPGAEGGREDRLMRALLCVLEPGGDEEAASDTAEWFAAMMTAAERARP